MSLLALAKNLTSQFTLRVPRLVTSSLDLADTARGDTALMYRWRLFIRRKLAEAIHNGLCGPAVESCRPFRCVPIAHSYSAIALNVAESDLTRRLHSRHDTRLLEQGKCLF